jgi:hypothetical protein
MPELRQYTDLPTMLTYETTVKDPQAAADRLIKQISEYAPDFEILVCFVGPDPAHPWLLLPVPSDAMRNLDDASISLTSHAQKPVAYWKRSL